MICTVPRCGRPVLARELCNGHYERLRRLGDVQADRPLRSFTPKDGVCVIEGCTGKRHRNGRCQPHYLRGDDAILRPEKNASVCILDGCGRPAPTRGYRGATGVCEFHQKRAKHGVATDAPLREVGTQTAAEYVAAHVDRSGGPDACWPYTGPLNPQGYGIVHVEKRQRRESGGSERAHRIAYTTAYGPDAIPEGFHVDHMCHWRDASCAGGAICPHRRCCNPRHLDAVEPSENLRRSAWGACESGHPSTSQEFRAVRVCKDCGDGVEHPVPLRELGLWAWSTYRKSRRRG